MSQKYIIFAVPFCSSIRAQENCNSILIYNCTFKVFHLTYLCTSPSCVHQYTESSRRHLPVLNIHWSDLPFLWHLSSLHPLCDPFPWEIKVLCVLSGISPCLSHHREFLFNPLWMMLIFEIKVHLFRVFFSASILFGHQRAWTLTIIDNSWY